MPVKSAGIVTRTLIRPTSTKLRCGGVELGNFVWIYFTCAHVTTSNLLSDKNDVACMCRANLAQTTIQSQTCKRCEPKFSVTSQRSNTQTVSLTPQFTGWKAPQKYRSGRGSPFSRVYHAFPRRNRKIVDLFRSRSLSLSPLLSQDLQVQRARGPPDGSNKNTLRSIKTNPAPPLPLPLVGPDLGRGFLRAIFLL